MVERIVVDPITRIEGHLRIEAQMDGDSIAEAYSSGTMVRGIEIILRGRDPRDAWAFAQRICGVCTLVHGIASVRAVEDALDVLPDAIAPRLDHHAPANRGRFRHVTGTRHLLVPFGIVFVSSRRNGCLLFLSHQMVLCLE